MKNLLRKLHIGGSSEDQVDAGRIIEGRPFEGSNSNSNSSSRGPPASTPTSQGVASATAVFTPLETKETKASGLTTFLNAVGNAVGRVGQVTSSSTSSQVSSSVQSKQRLESVGSTDDDNLFPQIFVKEKRSVSLEGEEINQSSRGSQHSIQNEEDFQVQMAMALSVSNVAHEAENAQIEAVKRMSLGLSPSSGNSHADLVSYRYWACNVVDYDERIPDGFYDVYGAERMPSLPDLAGRSISEPSKLEAVLVDRSSDPELVSLEVTAANLAAREAGLQKTLLAQNIALLVVERLGGTVGNYTAMLTQWRMASSDMKRLSQSVILTLGRLTIGLTRHRALLFKVLADCVGLHCQLLKGRHYPGVEEEGAVNIIQLEDSREYMIDLMGAPGTLIPSDKPQRTRTQGGSEVLSPTDASPRSFKTEISLASVEGSSLDSQSSSHHSTQSTLDTREVSKDQNLMSRKVSSDAVHRNSNKVEVRHHSEPGEVAALSARRRLHARSPSWTEGMLDNRQITGGRPLKDVFIGVANEHPQLRQKLHDVLLESGVTPPLDLLAEISPKEFQASVLEDKRFGDGKKVTSEVQHHVTVAPLRKKIVAVRGRPPSGVAKLNQPDLEESKDKLQRLNSVEGLGERRPLGGGQQSNSTISPAFPAIVPLMVIPSPPEGIIQPDIMLQVPVAAAAAATAAVVASTMVAVAKADGDTSIQVPMAAAATATAAVVAATSAAAGRRVEGKGSSPHGSHEKEKTNHRSGKPAMVDTRSNGTETERIDVGEECKFSGDKGCNDLDVGSPGNSDGRGDNEGKNGTGERVPSSMCDGLEGEISLEAERSSDEMTDFQRKRMDAVLEDVAEWEIPWDDMVIGERIGLGSYGEVYRGDWRGSEVAVKKFVDQDISGDALEEFRLEVRIMKRLRHPNVVLFMGAVTRPPNLSIVTEFLRRGSLYRLLHRPNNQLDERRRLRMALDVAKGMNYLHNSTPTIVHRDLKSPNLLVDKNWVVKVCDFGLSRMKHSTFLSSKSTAGTPEWMAPEMLRNEPSNEKCDVYSFGVILWELATLRQPWAGMNPMQVVGAVGFQHRRLDIPSDMDPQLANIIRECWQNDPNARPSFSQLMTSLRPLQRPLVAQQDSQRPPRGQSAASQPLGFTSSDPAGADE